MSFEQSCRTKFLRRILIVTLFAGIAGCSSTPVTTFDLKPLEPAPASRGTVHAGLVVPPPTATLILDSQRIAIKTGSDLAYLKGAQWSARLPDLVQARLISSFENSHRVLAFREPGSGTRYRLEADIRHFEADVTQSSANVEIYVRLIGARGEIIADHDFKAAAFSPHDDGPSVSAAIDTALGQVLRQIVIWTASKV
jgi:cholesterol transport system auxiliary component